MTIPALLVALLLAGQSLEPGDHLRQLEVDGRTRWYLVHVPPKHDPREPAPVVLVFHGAVTNAPIMALFCGLNAKADEAGFVAVYPNGSGRTGFFLTWNAGAAPNAHETPDDVEFVRRLLDDLATVVRVDPSRVYATGHSAGGMMVYRLAAELPERIAAIAPVAACMAVECRPRRPVPVIHFHGTEDARVPFGDAGREMLRRAGFRTVAETIDLWVRVNRCERKPEVSDLPDKAEDGTTVKRFYYPPGRRRAEVVLLAIEGGGHTWPGRNPIVPIGGRSTQDVSANDLIWEFFQTHPKAVRRN